MNKWNLALKGGFDCLVQIGCGLDEETDTKYYCDLPKIIQLISARIRTQSHFSHLSVQWTF